MEPIGKNKTFWRQLSIFQPVVGVCFCVFSLQNELQLWSQAMDRAIHKAEEAESGPSGARARSLPPPSSSTTTTSSSSSAALPEPTSAKKEKEKMFSRFAKKKWEKKVWGAVGAKGGGRLGCGGRGPMRPPGDRDSCLCTISFSKPF